MKEFQRARSDEQKSQRLSDIKEATAALFSNYPYHEITLTTIADKLGWSRANLYKYVATKEEIFLELAADARDAYYQALRTAFNGKKELAPSEAAELWASVSNAHQDWPLYGTILMNIIEVNVTVDRLKVFKKGYYDQLGPMAEQLAPALGIAEDTFSFVLNTVFYHEVGLVGHCAHNPLVAQAISELGIERSVPEYEPAVKEFIQMCLEHYQR